MSVRQTLRRHCQGDDNSIESPQGITISSELEHSILGIG